MTRPTTTALATVLLILALASGAQASADWFQGPTGNLTVTTAAGDQVYPAAIPDGAGGSIVAWHSFTGGSFDVYVQHILSTGVVDPSWPSPGLSLSTPGTDQYPTLCSDGAGGAYVVVLVGANASLVAHHVLSTGVKDPSWLPDGEVVIGSAARLCKIVSDGAGGAFVTWDDARLGPATANRRVYAQHLISTGVDLTWPGGGTRLCPTIESGQTAPVICSNGAGGAFVAWNDLRSGNVDIFAQQLNGAGALAWSSDGVPVCAATGEQRLNGSGGSIQAITTKTEVQSNAIAPDGAGGFLATWIDLRTSVTTGIDIYLQRMTSGGSPAPGWPTTGVAACTATGNQITPELLSDGAGGAIVFWSDSRPGAFGQHVTGAGVVNGPANGLLIDAQGGGLAVAVRDAANGAVVLNQRFELSDYNLYAQHLVTQPSFALDATWPASGLAVSTPPGSQYSGSAASVRDGQGGMITLFVDARDSTTTGYDLYAQRVLASGALPGASPCTEHLGPAVASSSVEYGELAVSGDVNEDGVLDLVTLNASLALVQLGQGLGGVGDGTFGAGQFWFGSTSRGGELMDVNDDGILDFIGVASPGLVVRLGQGSGGIGDGTFGAATLYPTSFGVAMVTGDFNEDGIVDVALIDSESAAPDQVEVRMGQGSGGVGNGTFGPPTPVYSTGSGIVMMTAGDFNEDGILDLVVGEGQQLRVLLGGGSGGHGDGTFSQGQLLLLAPSYPPGALVTGDFNEDGITDLAGSRAGTVASYGLMVLLGQGTAGLGDGTFANPVVYGAGTDARDLGLGDWNRDGIADVAVSDYGAGMVSLRLGNGSGGVGDGTFGAASAYPTQGKPHGLVVGDFVEDGSPDVAVTLNDSSRVAVLPWLACGGELPAGIVVQSPNGGEGWMVGSEQTITWSRGGGVIAVNVEVSRDGGQNWEQVASNLTGTSFAWTVTGPSTGTARVRVTDATVAGRSDIGNANFSISQPVSVELPPLDRISLSAAYPNPFVNQVSVDLDLPREDDVIAEIHDVGGRRVALLVTGRMSAGRHRLNWDGQSGRNEPAGLYFLRVRSSGLEMVRPMIKVR